MANRFNPSTVRTVLLLVVAHQWQVREATDLWDYAKQDEEQWAKLCFGGWQSPINIEPKNAIRSEDQMRLNYKPWRLEDVASAGVESDGVPRIRFKERQRVGKVQVGSGYSNFDEYVLTSVEVHAPSEHTMRKASWALELQLWHESIGIPRIERLADDAEKLSEAVNASKSRFSTLGDAEEKLRNEVMGGVSPWSTHGRDTGAKDPKVTVDWVDSTKSDIETVSKLLREDTKALLEDASKLRAEVKDLVALQKRPMASHRLALSIFVLRAAPVFLGSQNGTATSLVRWLSNALLQADSQEEVELKSAMGEGHLLYSYDGSLPRPPCTPNVRWFILGEPQAVAMEQLSLLLTATKLGGMISGDARDVQAFGQDRRLYEVEMKWEAFEAPVLQSESVPQGRMKIVSLIRHCKVFLLCSVLLLITPILFQIHKHCFVDAEDSDAVGLTSLPLKSEDEDKTGLPLKEWSPKKRIEERLREQGFHSPRESESKASDAIEEAKEEAE